MNQKKKNLLWAVLCPVLYMVILWNLVPFVYGIVDDRTMMEVVSGQYLGSPDGHTIFIGYLYSSLIAGLYRLIPGMDWYALGFLALQGGCMGLILYRLLNGQKKTSARIWISLLVLFWCIVLGIRTVTQVTFTTTAAVLAVTVLFWYVTMESWRVRDLIILFLLCFLTAEMRFPVYCMIVPVCGIFWLFRLWDSVEEKKADKRQFLVPVIAVGAVVLHLACFYAGYRSEGWKTYNDYNDVCTIIFDYDDYMFPRYEDDTELYNQVDVWSKVRAKNLYYYNYTTDDQIDTDFFGKYLDIRREMVRQQRKPVARLAAGIQSYIKNVFTGVYDYGHLLALFGYAVLILWYGFRKEWKYSLKTCCVFGIQFVLWMYLIYRGRVPLRVQICMNLMLIVSLILLWKERLSRVKPSPRVWKTGAGVMLGLLCVSSVWYVKTVRLENQEMSRQNQNVEALKEYCMNHPENFYFNDVVSMAMSSWNVHLLPRKPFSMNYISLGDWISFSPLWQQKLEQKEITNVSEALYGQDHIYLICNFDRGLEYLTLLYDDVSCTEVDKVAGFRIYQLNCPEKETNK